MRANPNEGPSILSRLDRLQAVLLVAGAAFDAAFGLPMLLAPGSAARLLAIELPDEPVWFQLCGVLLLIVACAYVIGARSGMRHAIAVAAGLGRIAGAFVLFRAAGRGQGAVFMVAAASDALIGWLHVATASARWSAARRIGMIGPR